MNLEVVRCPDLHQDVVIGQQVERQVEMDPDLEHGERAPDRLAQRNGYRDRDWATRVGTVERRIPKRP